VGKFTLRLIVLALLCPATHTFCQDMNPPIYSEVIPTSSGLPYDPATDTRESFQAPNGKTVEVLVKGPAGSGTYMRAIGPGETPDAYFPAVVSEAMKAGAHHLVIPKGVYSFNGPKLCTSLKSPSCSAPTSCNANQYWNCQPHWTIGQYPNGPVPVPNSVTDLDIDFSDSELDFSAPVIGIWILETQRLRLRNFTVDWPSLPIASLGTITPDPLNPGHNALVIDRQYLVEDRYQGGPVQIQAVDIWDGGPNSPDPPGTFDPKSNNNFEEYFIFGNAPQPTYVGDETFSCKSCNFRNSPTDPSCSFFQGCANFDIFAPGTRVIVRHYTYNGFAFLVNWSNDVTFENVKLRTGPGMGIAVGNNGGYRGFRLANSEVKRGPGRLISTASDAINLGLQADLILEHNDVGYQGDDSVNIHSVTASITRVDGAQIGVAGPCDPDPMDAPIQGDELAFFDENFVYKDTARVVASNGNVCGTLSLTLDHAIAGLDTSSNLLDLTQQPSARFMVHDNYFHECHCHGVWLNAPYGLIDRNSMYGNTEGAIGFAGGAGAGPGATNLSITHNLMNHPGQETQYSGTLSLIATTADGNIVTSPVFEKIQITDNEIANSPGPAAIFTSSRDFSFDGNAIFNANQVQTAPANYGALSTLDSVLVYKSSDGLVCGTERIGKTTGLIGNDPSNHGVLVHHDCTSDDSW
jgi:hypothetical protein